MQLPKPDLQCLGFVSMHQPESDAVSVSASPASGGDGLVAEDDTAGGGLPVEAGSG